MMEWQPIETVPKGTFVLMCDMKAGEVRKWAYTDWMVNKKCCGDATRKPTHWMPLPAPPMIALPVVDCMKDER